jgi:hypothetical protein
MEGPSALSRCTHLQLTNCHITLNVGPSYHLGALQSFILVSQNLIALCFISIRAGSLPSTFPRFVTKSYSERSQATWRSRRQRDSPYPKPIRNPVRHRTSQADRSSCADSPPHRACSPVEELCLSMKGGLPDRVPVILVCHMLYLFTHLAILFITTCPLQTQIRAVH